jgi:polyisoprenoid-binding protein YceI
MRVCWLLPCLAMWAVHPARAADLFHLDQRYGTIAFSVIHFGAFASVGSFPKFMGNLSIDRAHPENTKIDVEADARSVVVPSPDGTEMLRGPEFFDIAHYPAVRFTSGSIKGLDPKHFEIDGTLEIRGIRHPRTLEATLVRDQADPVTGIEVASFSVSGTLLRSAYGMTAEPVMIANEVKLMIAARIELPARRKPASP